MDYETKGGFTALIEAARLGKASSCRALVAECHARADRESRTGLTALIAAAEANEAEGCKAMIDLHANLNYENRNGDTAVFVAAHRGAMDALSALLAGGAAAHHENNFGYTPLTSLLKVDARDFDMAKTEPAVRVIVKFGASPNQESAFGNTAVAQAAMSGHADILPVLRSLGANFDFENKYGKTALALAAEKAGPLSIHSFIRST